jgi:hypothetical protein
MAARQWWWSRIARRGSHDDAGRVEDAIERLVQVMNPRLRFANRYRLRLAPATAVALDYIVANVAAVAPVREASRTTWYEDPYIHAFFATADDVPQICGRSPTLRKHFDHHPAAAQAYALLGMEMCERTTVSFSDHRLAMCAASEVELRAHIARRLLDQLALEALRCAAAAKARRTQLLQEHALLAARLKLLERQGTGVRGMTCGTEPQQAALARVKRRLEQNSLALNANAAAPQRLDAELEQLRVVLAEPAKHVRFSSRTLRLDGLNVVVDEGAAGTRLEFQVARVPGEPPMQRAFALVRIGREQLLTRERLLDEASAYLHASVRHRI